MHVYLHVSYIWGHRWNAEVELHWEGNWQSAVMKVATVGEEGNARAREPSPIGSQLIPSHRSRCHSERVRINLMMEIVT